jgi:sulfide:quinone oxidoreductase
MKHLVILGAGTAGTMVANKMARELDAHDWQITIVDRDEVHHYQPGYLFIPFGIYEPADVIRPKRNYLPQGVKVIISTIKAVEPEKSRVLLTRNDQVLNYDYLVIATGSHIHPEETAGMMDNGWQENIFDFYTLNGAAGLARFLDRWEGGRLVLNVAEMPIKCPVAPLEFLFLADWYFHKKGIRDQVELVYATPLSGAFTKPRSAEVLGHLLEAKGIHLETEFNIGEVNNRRSVIRSWDEREIGYDLLITVPTHMGADFIARSGLGDDLNFVRTDKHTLQSKAWENIWVIGDAANVPASKAGSVAHFMLDTLIENLKRHMAGLAPLPSFDGHSNCFIETGFEKAILIDFNYEVEPLPGTYPLPGMGPFSLLKESTLNHWGKMAFKWVYWNRLLKAGDMPVSASLSMTGKHH